MKATLCLLAISLRCLFAISQRGQLVSASRTIASAWGTEPVTQHLYTPEAPEKYGIKVSSEAKEVLGAMSQLGLNLYPITRIRWGVFKNKEVVIRGWQTDNEFSAKLESIISLLESIDR